MKTRNFILDLEDLSTGICPTKNTCNLFLLRGVRNILMGVPSPCSRITAVSSLGCVASRQITIRAGGRIYQVSRPNP